MAQERSNLRTVRIFLPQQREGINPSQGRRVQSRSRLERLSAQLGSLDPTAVLSRGYALVLRGSDSGAVTTASALKPEDRLTLQFAADRAKVRVETTEAGGPRDA